MGYTGLIDNARDSSLHDGLGGRTGGGMGMIDIAIDSRLHDRCGGRRWGIRD